MMVKLTKEEVEKACELWIEGCHNSYDLHGKTSEDLPMALHGDVEIKCKFVRSGVECNAIKKPKVEKVKPMPKPATM